MTTPDRAIPGKYGEKDRLNPAIAVKRFAGQVLRYVSSLEGANSRVVSTATEFAAQFFYDREFPATAEANNRTIAQRALRNLSAEEVELARRLGSACSRVYLGAEVDLRDGGNGEYYEGVEELLKAREAWEQAKLSATIARQSTVQKSPRRQGVVNREFNSGFNRPPRNNYLD